MKKLLDIIFVFGLIFVVAGIVALIKWLTSQSRGPREGEK